MHRFDEQFNVIGAGRLAQSVSVMGEQVNLIRFQQAYNAAANFIRIAEELGRTVLDLIQ
jgi:flagellar hook-associated protein FlgK